MTRIFLVRHAEAEGNLYRRAHGHYDGLITGRGYEQIEQLRKRFEHEKLGAVYSSDLTRARVTAAAIYEPHGLTLCTDKRLREVSIGEWEDMAWGDIEYREPEMCEYFNSDPEKWNVEGGESYLGVQERMTERIKEIAGRHDGETVAVLSHGFAIRTFLCGVLGVPSCDTPKVPYCDNTAVALLRYDNGNLTAEYHGDNSHLHPDNSTFAQQSWWRPDTEFIRENLRYMPFSGARDKRSLELCREEVTTEFRSDAVFTAFIGDEPVGFLGLDTTRDEDNVGWIYHIYVAPDQRHKDFGVQLLGQAISVYRRLGRDKLRIETAEDSAAIELCLKYGFVKTDNKRGTSGVMCTMEKDILAAANT